MALSQVSIEILECLLTHRAAFKSNGHSAHDAVNVKTDSTCRHDNTSCYDIKIVAQGAWTSLLSCESVLDGCPSLAAVLSESLCESTSENEACDRTARMTYTAVNQSRKEMYTVTMETGGLNIIHQGAASTEENTQPEVTIILEFTGSMMELTKCTEDVRNFLFKFKLVHPSISVDLSSSIEELAVYNFGGKHFESTSVCHGINMITDPRYYMKSDGDRSTPCHHLTPVSEGSFAFLSPSLSTGESRMSVRCVTVATLVPSPSPSMARACTPSQLFLSVYGPGSFPLAHPAWSPVETRTNLKHLVKWEDLGLVPVGGEMEAGSSFLNQPIGGSFIPDLQVSLSECTTDTNQPIIHLMLFLKENFKGYSTTAQERLALLNRVRQEFPHICAQQISRMQKIVHDTLAKLLGLSGPVRKVRAAIMKSAVPSCTSSLHNIISRSTNDVFRRRCLDAVQASSCVELSDRLSLHLNAVCEKPRQYLNDRSQSAVDSQRQFPLEENDEDEERVPLDESNLASSSSSSSLMLHQEQNQDSLLMVESEENADFDLLDETNLHRSDSLQGNQDAIPQCHSMPRPSSCPSHNQEQPSSSFIHVLTAAPSLALPGTTASRHLPPSSASPKTPAILSTPCASTSSSSSLAGSSSQLHPPEGIRSHGDMNADRMMGSSRRCDAGLASGDQARREKADVSDVQMMQETLSGELGNDWFEMLMDHEDWMTNEF